MNCLHISDGVAINESILTQQHIMMLQNILPSMLAQEKNARQYYICSIFPNLNAVISKNLSANVIHKYARMSPLAASSTIKLIVDGTQFCTIQTSQTSELPYHTSITINQTSSYCMETC